MTIILEAYPIPKKGKIDLNLKRSFEIKVTAEEACRKVNGWLSNEVSYMLAADPATLVVGEQIIWRVPVWIGFPHSGRAGVVGVVEVDVQTGKMNNLPEQKRKIEQNLEALKSHVPPYKAKSSQEGAEYLAKEVPPAPKLIISENEDLQTILEKT